jgi:OFA family oxalate/formate antiporter-like MFS transporter
MKNKGILTTLSAFFIMLFLGSIYAWSIFVPYLKTEFNFNSAQTQLIFGSVIAVFSFSMLYGHFLILRFGARKLVMLAALLYALGYALAYFSAGSFILIWLGIGILSGIGTGFGYLVSISVPVLWFPHKKGWITGIVSAGFGGGAIVHSLLADILIENNIPILDVICLPAFGYALLMVFVSLLIFQPDLPKAASKKISLFQLLRNADFIRLFIGILTGTFAGLLIIGNLKPIGMQWLNNEIVLVAGIAVLSFANFLGRLFWGWLSDYLHAIVLIPLALTITGITTVLLTFIPLNIVLYLVLSFAVGFSFGAHLVLYAKETAQRFGVENLGRVYPFEFLGYGLSGILGPLTGGFLFVFVGMYTSSALLSFAMCMLVALGILVEYFWNRKTRNLSK